MKALSCLILASVLVSGCSNNPTESPTSSDTSMTSSSLAPALVNEGKPVLPPVELLNKSYAYPGPTDPPISDSVSVPAGVRNLAIRMQATADCPVFAGAQQPALTLTSPSGKETVIDSFGGNRGLMFSGQCNNPSTTPQVLGETSAEAFGEEGSWSIASQGTFTGDIRLIVVGSYR